MNRHLALASALLLAACGKDPISYSAPVGITFPALQSSAASSSPMTVEKDIATEQGNPYGAFMNEAKARIGHDPSSIAVTHATLELLGTSTNVTSLAEVFTGTVTVEFVMNGTNAVYPVGTVANPTGVGPVGLALGFDFSSFNATDRASLYQGQFKVMVSGPPASGFGTRNGKADLQTVFEFVAYE